MSKIPNEAIDAEIVEELVNVPTLKETTLPYEVSYIDELVHKFSSVPSLNAEDGETDTYTEVKQAGILISKVINAIEKQRKFLTDPALKYQKETKAKFDKEKKKLEPIRDLLKVERAKVDGYLEQKRIEAEEAEEARIEHIKGLILNTKNLPLQHFNSNFEALTKVLESFVVISAEVYQEFYQEALDNQNYVISQLQTARDNAIAVENAKKLQDEKDAEAKRIKEEEDRKLQAKRDELERDRTEFNKQKEDLEAEKRAIHEEESRKIAEYQAEELMKKQEAEKRAKVEQDKKNFDNAKLQLIKELREFHDMEELAEAIIRGDIGGVYWEVQGE